MALRILLTILITVDTAGNSFNVLKTIKIYLPSTIGIFQLKSLALLSIKIATAQTVDTVKLR